MSDLTHWDMQCPQCDNDEHFRIEAQAIFVLTSAGLGEYGDVEYDDGSYCECDVCYYDGIIADFRKSRQPNPEDLVV